MSDRPPVPPPKVSLKDIVNELKGWYDLGLQLDVPVSTLDRIKAQHLEDRESLRQLLHEWLQLDVGASYGKLANALDAVNQRVLADKVRRLYGVAAGAVAALASGQEMIGVAADAVAVAPTGQEKPAETDPAITEKALEEIMSKFAALIIEVRKAVEIKVDTKDIKVKDIRQFLVDFSAGECDIPKEADLCEIFESMSRAKLWRYDHHSPLKKLVEFCLPKEHPAVGLTSEYISRYTDFCATTSIFNFAKLSQLQESDLPEDMQVFSPKKDNRYYRKLTVKLGLKKKISELTLKYVNDLWESLQQEFDLSPLTAVIDKIVEDSLEITWLVLPNVVEKIRATLYKSTDFLQQHSIAKIDLYNRITLYSEEWFEGSTPLYRACFTGNLEEVKRLLDGGAKVNEKNNNVFGETPLMGACHSGDLDTITLLLEYRPDIDSQNKNGLTGLMVASACNHFKVLTVLLHHRASVNIHDTYVYTALIWASMYGGPDMVEILLKHGATVDHRNQLGSTALMRASQCGNGQNVKILLQYGAVVDLTNRNGMTALMCASVTGQTDCARSLLQAGANCHLKSKRGRTALWFACANNYSQTAQLLIEFGANVNLLFNHGTVLSLACKKGHTHLAITLLAHGAMVDHQDKKGQSPLHHAAVSGHNDTVKALLENGVCANLQDNHGWTALFVAAQQGHYGIVKKLLQHGADPNIPSKKTKLTSLDVARNESHDTVCQLLEAYGAKDKTQLTEGIC